MPPYPRGEALVATKHVVGFSGGIDSQACAKWVRERYPAEDVILLNTEAGRNEHPITTEFVAEYSRTVHPVIVVTPIVANLGVGRAGSKRTERRKDYPDDTELTFELAGILNGGWPARKAQWCTEYLKLVPLRRWMRENLYANGFDVIRYVGLRRDESAARANTPDCKWDDFHDCEVHYPLAAWSKEQCFEYVQSAGEPINPLYRMGFGRVGCAPCVNGGKEDIRQWAARFPEMIDKIRGWERRVGKAFFQPCVPGKTVNFVDEVVAWSRTARGGRQLDLPVIELEAAAGTCSSKYGLCE